MTDKRIKEDCPFCDNKKENISIISYGNNFAEIRCTKCGCILRGSTKQDAIDKWNCRSYVNSQTTCDNLLIELENQRKSHMDEYGMIDMIKQSIFIECRDLILKVKEKLK